MDVSEKVDALAELLSVHMGAEVEALPREFKTEIYWFRVLVSDVGRQPLLGVALPAFEDHAVEKIWNDLERQQVPGMLLANPSQHLLYTTRGKVKKYDHPT